MDSVISTTTNRTNQLDEKGRLYRDLEKKYGFLSKGEGIYVWDTQNKKYYDFLAGHATVSQGHSNKKLIAAMTDQMNKITLTSRIFFNENLGLYQKKLCEIFGYDKVLLMNTGAEAGESALKIAKRWGYYVKKIPKDQAKIVFMLGNYWGRTYLACATSEDPSRYEGFGPYPGEKYFKLIEYNNSQALEEYLQEQPNVCCVMLEPIQGEKGTIIPAKGYLKKVRELCTKYNVLMCCDEIQTGLGRTGKMLAEDHENVRADIVLLGKALSGGMYPISAVLCDDYIMNTITPGSHGSTYGGNSLACAVGIAALDYIIDENLVQNSEEMGFLMLEKLKKVQEMEFIKEVRGKGLLGAIEFWKKEEQEEGKIVVNANQFCERLKDFGLLAKPAYGCIIRLSPPLVINRQEMIEAMEIVYQVAKTFLQIN